MSASDNGVQHPYQNLPEEAYWRSGVAAHNPLAFQRLYTKKFAIGPDMAVASAGSCFAQHIGRHMAKSGFNYRDFEPAPGFLSKETARTYGYHLYSARYGNIYTVQQLEQLLERATGRFTPSEDVWEKDGRYYDPFRPTIEPDGFASEKEFRIMQRAHFGAVKRLFNKTDVFIFTLGLTEAWVNKEDGSVYPICPGTAAGSFDPAKYEFRNFTTSEVVASFRRFRERVRAINPGIRFLLTVSPVPLTATASGNHVLVASSYSKAVLRAAAGELTAEDAGTDYFPSYEIVSSHPVRAMFFDGNLRTVTPRGVDFVMEHFFAQHSPPTEKAPETASPAASDDDLVCEEELLAAEALL
ncbi:GSCFA family protein [Kordiimonas lacus]|uniref:GSCFA family protein n=2 Tax=Kordiimonas lacus TaxID=637679 RepID=A0A1G6ZGJ4_9PROT|nr:GSCFA family protein [Kordiimonas lacus]